MFDVARKDSCVEDIGQSEVDKESLEGGGCLLATNVDELKQKCGQTEDEATNSDRAPHQSQDTHFMADFFRIAPTFVE